MNIAVYHNLPSGGARRAMVEMVKGLIARGHIVDEYCPETADRTFLSLEGTTRHTKVLPFHPHGVAKTRIPLLTPYVTSARLASDLSTLAMLGKQAAQIINQQDYDIVFTHDCQFVYAPDVLRFVRQPSVHYCHAATSASTTMVQSRVSDVALLQRAKNLYYAPAHWAYPRLRLHQTKHNLHAARYLLTNSNFAAAELLNAFDVTPRVCHLGVDVERFRPLGLQRDSFVLTVGAIHYHKGYRFLIEALALLPDKERPSLVVAANTVEKTEFEILQRLAATLNVSFSARTVFDEAEMVELYNRAAAFVYAPIREPWGLAVVEAMACGAPVVAVNEGGVNESVLDGETGLLTGRIAASFASALEHVLKNPAFAYRLGTGGVARVRENFTWAKTVSQLETVFLESRHR